MKKKYKTFDNFEIKDNKIDGFMGLFSLFLLKIDSSMVMDRGRTMGRLESNMNDKEKELFIRLLSDMISCGIWAHENKLINLIKNQNIEKSKNEKKSYFG